jgi:cyclophilin family peptidyl-prolyl cis-trans isomerase
VRVPALAIALTLALLAGCTSSPATTPTPAAQTFDCPAPEANHLEVNTTQGCFAITLRPDMSPKAVAHIVALAKSGFYDGIPFHRYVANFVVQGGDPNCKGDGWKPENVQTSGCGSGGSGTDVPFENNTLKHVYGAVGLASVAARGPVDSQFYIVLPQAAEHQLDGAYEVFGGITNMDVPLKLRAGDVMVHVTAG